MLTKKILKSILNVKYTAIDDMKILSDGTIAIKAHPNKAEQWPRRHLFLGQGISPGSQRNLSENQAIRLHGLGLS